MFPRSTPQSPLPYCTYLCAIHLEFASLNSYELQVRHMFMALFSETRKHLSYSLFSACSTLGYFVVFYLMRNESNFKAISAFVEFKCRRTMEATNGALKL